MLADIEKLRFGQSLVTHVECQFILGHMAVRGNQYILDFDSNLKDVTYPFTVSNFSVNDGWTAKRDSNLTTLVEGRQQCNPKARAGNVQHPCSGPQRWLHENRYLD